MVDLIDPLDVEVYIDDDWHPGTLYSWRRSDDREEWSGHVDYRMRGIWTLHVYVPLGDIRRVRPKKKCG